MSRVSYLKHPLCLFKVTAGKYECAIGLDEVRPFLPQNQWQSFVPQLADYAKAREIGTERIAASVEGERE